MPGSRSPRSPTGDSSPNRRISVRLPTYAPGVRIARRGPRSPLKTAAVTICSLLALYYYFRTTDPSSVSLEDSLRDAMGARRPSKSVQPQIAHGDARDLGFQPVKEQVPPPKVVEPAAAAKVGVDGLAPGRRPPPPARPVEARPPVEVAAPQPKKQRLDEKPMIRPPAEVAQPPRLKRPAEVAEPDDEKLAADSENAANDEVQDDVKPIAVKDDLAQADEGVLPPALKKVEEVLRAKKKAPLLAGQAPDRKDKWGNAGWQQRFKQKAGGGVPEQADTAPRRDAEQAPKPESELLSHPLVAQYATMDVGKARVANEDSFQADASRDTVILPKHNLTVCTLIPGEGRFLPEWLVYHRLMGVDHFALYDTSAGGAHGAAEVDGLADKMAREGKGDLGPTAEEIKSGILGTGAEGIAADGFVHADRVAGLERWLEMDDVSMHYMKFKDKKGSQKFHQNFIDHCSKTFSKASNWLIHLDIDEFLSMAEPLYGPKTPYTEDATAIAPDWRYPLHDLLDRPLTSDAACIPVPHIRFRNLGIRELGRSQGVLDTQTTRDAVKQSTAPEKTFIHTAFSSEHVKFDGPHSCRVQEKVDLPEGVSGAIKNSQGLKLQDGGLYESTRLPTEPLAIAHYVQRDLADCQAKLGLIDDQNSAHAKGRGTVICEEFYLPTRGELSSETFRKDPQNRFLIRTPPDGTVVEDLRVRDSWAARATKVIIQSWRKATPPNGKEIEAARRKVKMLVF